MSGTQFERMRRLSLALAGIQLADRHRELLSHRCRRLKIDNPASLDALLASSEEGDPSARQRFIGLVTTCYTGFFRNPSHFAIAGERAVEAVRRRGAARLWSAAAATGEEPYSLAISVIESLHRDDPPVTIVATDINPETMAAAASGEFGETALRAFDAERRARFFSEPAGAGRWRVSAHVRRMVQFMPLNLTDAVWPVEGPFDVILCRNVLMYLEAGHRESVLRRMASLIGPGGLLILDPAEYPGPAQHLFGAGKNGVYSPRTLPVETELI